MEPQKTPSSSNDDKLKEVTSAFGTPPTDQTDNGVADTDASQTDASTDSTADTAASSDSEKPNVDADSEPEEPFAAPQTFKPGMGGDAAPADSPFTSDSSSSPEALSPMAAVPGSLPFAAPKSRKKGLLIGGIIAAVALVLLGGGAAAYYYVAVNKPENVLLQALGNALDEKKTETLHVSGVFSAKDDKSDMEVKATYTGAFSDKTGASDLNAKLDAVVTTMTLDVRSTDGKTAYVKLGGLDGLPQLLGSMMGSNELGTVYGPAIAAINDQWFEINESLVKQVTGGNGERLTAAEREKISKVYQENAFLVVKEVLADEEIKGVRSHHYKVVVDQTKLKAFVAAFKQANVSSLKLTDDDVKQFNDSLKDAQLDKYPVDVWISKSGKMLTKVAISVTEDGTTVSFDMTVDSYNKPVTVEKPADAKSILDVLGSFYGQNASDLPLPLDSGVSL